MQFSPSVYEHAAAVTAKNFEAVKKEVDRVVSLAENRDKVCIGTGCLPYETDPQMVLKTKEYILPKSLSRQPDLLRPAAKPDACVVSQKCSQRGENHASEHFWAAALASNFSLGLITTRLSG